MFSHILVPLDGSMLAEKALEKAVALAVENEASLTLFRVYEAQQALAAPSSRLDTYHLVVTAEAAQKQAEAYLREKMADVCMQVPHVETATLQLTGRIGEMIADYAEAHQVDLILMTSHGYTGVRRWILGSVTTETICATTCPVLVVPADD